MVVTIISAQFALLVRKSKIAGEQLSVRGKARIHGIAPAVNDPRIRKDAVNGTEMEKIAQILVDDSVCSRREAPQSFKSRFSDGPIAGFTRLEKRAQPHELAGAMHLRMGGQYLLDQRGAATRHAHD